MASCIEHWIEKRLGILVKLDPELAGELLYDGQIFFQLLQSYNFAMDCKKFEKAKDPFTAFQKLKELGVWFKILELSYDEMELRKIANKDGVQALRLLYDLFFALENKDHSSVIYNKRAIQTLTDVSNFLTVEQSKQSKQQGVQSRPTQILKEDPCLHLSKAEQQEIAQMYRDHQDRIRQKSIVECFKRRKKAKSQLSIKVDVNIEHFDTKFPFICKSNMEIPALELPTSEGTTLACTPQQYLDLLKLWRRKSYANENRSRKTQSKLLNALWEHMIKSQTEEFHEAFTNKLLQQSVFEKNLANRLNNVHKNYFVFRATSEAVKNQLETEDKSSANFETTFKVLQELNDDAYEEKKRLYELHQRLYQKKLRKRKERIYDMCYQTIEDILECAFKLIEFRQTIKVGGIPRKLENELKEAFIKGICDKNLKRKFRSKKASKKGKHVSDKKNNSRQRILEKIKKEHIILVDDECRDFLNEQNLHSYLYLTGPWFLEMLLPDLLLQEPELLITGFVIHRLLETKYPFPPPPPKADIPDYPFKIMLSPLNDSVSINKLKQLLNNSGIVIIDMPSATNYCIEVFKKEKSMSNIGQNLREKTKEFQKSVKEKKNKNKNIRKQKKKLKPSKREEEKKFTEETSSIKGSNRKMIGGESGKLEKAIQVPSEEEVARLPLGHSRAGLLGKLAFEVLHGGNKLTDIHLVYMLIEYIKTFENIVGWVLINYPLSFPQSALLEYLLGGIQVHLQKEFLESCNVSIVKLEEAPYIDVHILKEFEKKLEELRIQYIIDQLNKMALSEQEEEETIMTDELITEVSETLLEEPEGKHIASELSTESVKSIRELIVLRTSTILPRPNKPQYFAEGKSYFTKYIGLMRIQSFQNKHDLFDEGPASFSSISPYMYYDHLGIAEKISFKKMNSTLLKDIAKKVVITAECEVSEEDSTRESKEPPHSILVPSVSGRTDKSSSKRTPINAGSISILSPEESGESALIGSSSGLTNISERKYLVDYASTPEKYHYYEEEEEQQQLSAEDYEEEEMEELLVYPGDTKWEYVELPVVPTLQKALATIWETVEINYLNNLKEVFYLQRKLDSKVIPYKLYIRKACDKCLHARDNKQAAVADFQIMYNYVDEELRKNEDMKSELHCRVYELFNELCEMCDKKKRLAEMTRKEIINQNWVAHQAFAVVNIAINLMQIELDRYIDTLQILNDYYIASLQKLPPEKKYNKIILEKVKYPKIVENVPLVVGQKEKTEKQSFKLTKLLKARSKTIEQNSVPFNIKIQFLKDDDTQDMRNPADILISHNVEDIVHIVKNVKKHYDNIIKTEYGILLKEQLLKKQLKEDEQAKIEMLDVTELKELEEIEEIVDITKGDIKIDLNNENETLIKNKNKYKADVTKKSRKKTGGRRKSAKKEIEILANSKSESEKTKDDLSIASTTVDIQDFTLEGPYNNLLMEWYKAVEEETLRVKFRIKLIESRTIIDLDELLLIIKEVFQEFTKEIISSYHQGIKNVHLLTNLFKVAIEEGEIIKPLVVLHQDDFFIDTGTLLHPEVPPPPPTPLLEKSSTDFMFSIEQLTNIMEKLKSAAPDGIIEDSLVTILEDMIIFGSECGEPFVPKGWAQLNNYEIRTLISEIFGESVMIDWKDFLIFGLNLNFPSLEDLLEAREQLMQFDFENNETISWNNFQKVILWFEKKISDSLEDDLRIVLIKQFLFKLFRVSRNEMNYATLLMAFCKDEDPINGFAKALSLASGKPYVITARELYKCKDEKYIEAPYMAEYIIKQILWDVVNQAEGLIIKDIESEVSMDKYEWLINQHMRLQTILNDHREEKEAELIKLDKEIENSIWYSLVPYDMALSILIYFLRFHPLSPTHLYGSLKLAEELKQVYIEKGRWNVIRAYDLIESELMQNIFENTTCFRAIDLSLTVEKIVLSKKHKLSIFTEKETKNETKKKRNYKYLIK